MLKLRQYLDFLITMTDRELRARYKKAIFGFLWIFINPVFQMIVIGTVFSYFVHIPNYFLYLFAGLLPWNFFTSSLARGTPSFLNDRLLLKKAMFPSESIPLSIVLANLLHMLVASILFVFVLIALGYAGHINILLYLSALAWISILTGSIVIATSTLYVRFSDINFLTQAATTIIFYATPIIYRLDMIPKRFLPLFSANPLTGIFQLFQCSLVNVCKFNSNQLMINVFVSILIIVLAILVFKGYKKYLVDWL